MGSAKQGKTNSSNWSTALSQGWQDAFNVNQGASVQGSQSGQSIYAPQAGALGDIYAGAQGLATGTSPMAQQAGGVAQTARNAWQQALQPGGNPYFSQSVQGAIDQATQGFNRGVLPELTAQGVGAGAYGTSRDALARGEAAGLATQGMQQMVGNLYANQYANDLANRTNALGMAGQIQNMFTQPLTTAAGIVGGPTALTSSESFGESTNTGFGASKGGNVSAAGSAGKGTGREYGMSVGGK